MSIFYVLVAKRPDVVLAEYSEHSGNFVQIAVDLLKRIEPETKKTFELQEYLFHYIDEDGLILLCMTDKMMQKRIAFTFLADVRKRLQETYSAFELQNAKYNGLKTFKSELRQKMVSHCSYLVTLIHFLLFRSNLTRFLFSIGPLQ